MSEVKHSTTGDPQHDEIWNNGWMRCH